MTASKGSLTPECAISPTYSVETPDYHHAPVLAIWEVTRACDLACVHCRAAAMALRDPDELTLSEARQLFRQIHEMGTRLMVLSGGDPLKRPDIFELISSARAAGLVPSLSPSVTPLLDPESLLEGRKAGLTALSLSLDGGSAASHDAFRGVTGSFDRTLEIASKVLEAGLELRINTTVTSTTLPEMEAVSELVGRMGARTWSVFFLVPTGRALESQQITASQCEELLTWLYQTSRRVPFRIKTTEAPHYRRVVLQVMAAETGRPVEEVLATSRTARGRFVPGLNAARGFLFSSHHGEVYPSGFFPLPAGNVRETSLELIYRDSVLFRALRDPGLLKGRCGRCSFRSLCGGSRARAFAATGDPLGEDPLCLYEPALPLRPGIRAV